MRPVLKPGLRRVWRDRNTLQIGVDPRRAFAITGLTDAVATLLDNLDGTRDRAALYAHSAAAGVDEATAARLLELLTSQGAIEDASGDTSPLLRLERGDRERLAPDVASLSLLGERPGDGLDLFRRRRRAAVEVHGGGRVGSVVACQLAASGVGHVVVRDPRPTVPADLAPGGLGPEDVGTVRERAVASAIRRFTPSASTSLPAGRDVPDVAVLAPDNRVDPAVSHAMLRRGAPHLYAAVRETTGIVGPLVLPGRSSCLHCHDLYRTDRDRAWPDVLAQLLRGGPEQACDGALAALVAAHAVLQVLAHLEGSGPVWAVDGTLEYSLDDGRVLRRRWQPHPGCGCRWGEQVGDAEPPAPAGRGA